MKWLILACALTSATLAAAGDHRDDDDWWFYTTLERNSPRARQERADQDRQMQDEPQQLYRPGRAGPQAPQVREVLPLCRNNGHVLPCRTITQCGPRGCLAY